MRFVFDTPQGDAAVEVHVRPESSDLAACQQVFGRLDYDLRRLRRYPEFVSLYEQILSQGRKPLVLDLGANIGMATLYFVRAWPGCHVVAVEPMIDNFQLLFENTQELDAVTAWHAGIASAPGRLRIANPDAEDWAYRTMPAADCERDSIAAVTVNQILEEFPSAHGYEPFIVKIDVEGAEADLFRADTAWIERFPVLVIELHDWLLYGQANSGNFLRAVAPLDRDFVYIGENVFSLAIRR